MIIPTPSGSRMLGGKTTVLPNSHLFIRYAPGLLQTYGN